MGYELMNCICCKHWGKCPVGGTKPKGKAMRVLHDKFGETPCAVFLPDFITPAQFRERTGRKYPADAPVWAEITIDGEHRGWALATNRASAEVKICVFGDLVPSKDWKPEMTEKDKCMGGER